MKIKIKDTSAINIEGFEAFNRGDFYLSVDLFKQSLLINKNQPEIFYSLAVLFTKLNDKLQAIELYKKAINLKNDYTDAIYNLALLFYDLKKLNESLEMLNYVLSLEPSAEIYNNKGLVLKDLKRFNESLEMFDYALSLSPSAEIYNNKGLVLKDLKRFDESLEMFDYALSLSPSAEIYNNKGLVLKELDRLDDAIEHFNMALKLVPKFALAYVEIAGIFFKQGLRSLSVHNYKKALVAEPQSIEAHVGLGLIYLSDKNFIEGWDFYSYRTMMPDVFMMSPKSNKPLLSKASKGRLIIVAEQGIGDHIIYTSLLSDLHSANYVFDIVLNPKLISLAERSFSNINFLSSKVDIDDSTYNYQLPMGCIGQFTRRTLESFKSQPKKFLHANEVLTKKLRLQLKNDGQYLCGIAWKSQNEEFGQDKSVSLESLLPILKLPNITFVNLQYGDVNEEISTINKAHGINIKTIDEIDNFNDIDELASLIDACDFVVTTSNVTVHLAGGLGKETYLIVPFAHGRMWYWHEGDTQSIWYPSVFIHRQPSLNNWAQPISEIKHTLENKGSYERSH